MTRPENTLIVLGATSAVAHAYLRLVAAQNRFSRAVLVARNKRKLEIVAQDIAGRSLMDVTIIAADIGKADQVSATMHDILSMTETFDECLLAYGGLGDQKLLQTDSHALRSLLDTNFVSSAVWLEQIAAQFERQGHGHVIAIGSVAGDRGRQSNYIYGASKAGLERICEGLAHRFASSDSIHVTCVKPGFIDTPMTEDIEKSGPLWATPEQIASSINRAVAKKRVRVYAPWFWRFILMIIRALPVPIFHKTKL